MPSERIQRQIDRLLDEADEAALRLEWSVVRDRARAALAYDPENGDARDYLATAERGMASEAAGSGQSAVGNKDAGSVEAPFIAPAAPEFIAQPSGDAAPPPAPTHLSSLPAREGGTIADASALPTVPPIVGEGLVPSRPQPQPGTPAEGAGTLTPAVSQRERAQSALPGSPSSPLYSLLPTPSSRSEAMRHLDIAIAEFREMKMQPSLERALRHKEVLKA
jgi:hypothetical protein